MTVLTPLQRVEGWDQDPLVPGWIVADAGHNFGMPSLSHRTDRARPSIIALGIGAYLAGSIPLAEVAEAHGITETEALVLAAFRAGMDWQRRRKRRKRMDQAVEEGWARQAERVRQAEEEHQAAKREKEAKA